MMPDGGSSRFASLERIPFEWNGDTLYFFALAHVLVGKPVSTRDMR
jgi:hypothetical protein